MAGVVYYTGAYREFLGVCAREEKSERRRRSTGLMHPLLPEFPRSIFSK